MACTQQDVRRIARSLPGVVEARDRFAFSVRKGEKEKGFAWVWLERTAPKKARVPNPAVLAVRVAELVEKDSLLALDRSRYFTEPHYAGYPAVLVRLAEVDRAELEKLVTRAWRCVAPRALVGEVEGRGRDPASPARAWRGRSRSGTGRRPSSSARTPR